MTEDSKYDENIFIDEMESYTINMLEKIESDIREDVSTDKIQAEFTKKWRGFCSYFKDAIKPNESRIKIIPYNKNKVDKLVSDILLYHFLSTNRDIASMYIYELEKTQKFNVQEIQRLRYLEYCYLESEKIVRSILRYNFDDIEAFINENLEYFNPNFRLKFEIAILKFLKLLRDGMKAESLKFLYEQMFRFLDNFELKNEIRNVLMYLIKQVDETVLEKYMNNVIKIAHNDYCIIKSLPIKSFLDMVFSTGTKASSVLIEANKAFEDVDIEKITDSELLVKIPKAIKKAFHSLFVCPVLKCVCDKDNLPVLLECGHVISQNAVSQISKSGSKQLFKCPYCPFECNFYKSRVLFLKS